ncbi:MAG: HupE/UreJ family protein [Thiothrix sp.]|nr:MAG: HupE/UreJ family protein [Thiothrix sp.]
MNRLINGTMGTLLLLLLLCLAPCHADVLQPLKIELSVYPNGAYELDVHANLEELLSGAAQPAARANPEIKAEFKRLSDLSADALTSEFESKQHLLVDKIAIMLNGKRVQPKVSLVTPRGKTNKLRTSIVRLSGQLPENIDAIDFGYSRSLGEVVFRYRRLEEVTDKWGDWVWLSRQKAKQSAASSNTDSNADSDNEAPPVGEVFTDYLVLGFTHILPKGLDHILFIMGLFLLSTKIKPLIAQATAFTVAHTLTLGLTMQGLISLSPTIIEPLIAFSIAYVGIENILHKGLHRSRIVLVFLFGLLHGMGFASVLTDLGLPKGQFLNALLSFNLGVELGQLAILMLCFILVALPFRNKRWYRRGIVIPASVVIAIVGIYWGVERSMGIV